MDIRIVRDKITKAEMEELAKEFYVKMVKGVADVEREIIALGGEWHMDGNQILIEDGSKQCDLWGFNVYLADKKVEYISLINIRPAQNNRTLEVEDAGIRERMYNIINKLVE